MDKPTLLTACKVLLTRELTIAYRHRAELLNPLLFFVIVVCLFPLALTSQTQLLQTIAPGIIWVAALLATLLSLDKLFRSDAAEGFVDQLLLSRYSLSALVLVKIFAHWLVTGLPLIMLTPILALLLHLSASTTIILCGTLLLGTPVLSLIGAIFATLTLSLNGNGLLLPLLALPFYIPVLIFGAGSVAIAASGLPVYGQLAIMAAMLVIALPLAPWAAAAGLRVAVE